MLLGSGQHRFLAGNKNGSGKLPCATMQNVARFLPCIYAPTGVAWFGANLRD